MWISVEDIINFNGLKPKHLNLDNDDTVPAAVQNVCLRLTSNMVTLAIQKRDSPVIKVNDWTIQTVSSDIFTEDLKKDLDAFKVDKSNSSDVIDIFAITGE